MYLRIPRQPKGKHDAATGACFSWAIQKVGTELNRLCVILVQGAMLSQPCYTSRFWKGMNGVHPSGFPTPSQYLFTCLLNDIDKSAFLQYPYAPCRIYAYLHFGDVWSNLDNFWDEISSDLIVCPTCLLKQVLPYLDYLQSGSESKLNIGPFRETFWWLWNIGTNKNPPDT